MAAKLKSVLTSRILQLLVKVGLAALVLFWARSVSFSVWSTFLYLLVAAIFYLKPALHIGKFFPSTVVLISTPFFVPRLSVYSELLLVVGWGVMFFLLLGIKNLILLKRHNAYRFLNIIVVFALSIFLFRAFNIQKQITIFITFFFLLREACTGFIKSDRREAGLIAAVGALTLIEFGWAIFFLSANFIESATLLTLFYFVFYDIAFHYFSDVLSKEVVLRNLIVFISLSLAAILAL
jgi:hypothetical protein